MIGAERVARRTLESRPGLRQFLKFCVVGLSSFVIDMGLMNLLFLGAHLPLILAKTISFLTAVGNGFYWNRRWTFRSAGDFKSEYPKFVLTNMIGLILNLSIMTGAILLATRLGLIHKGRSPMEIVELIVAPRGKSDLNPLTVNLATIVATVFVMAWNFSAAKFWTFKK